MKNSNTQKQTEQQMMIKFLQFLYNGEIINHETYTRVKAEVKKEN